MTSSVVRKLLFEEDSDSESIQDTVEDSSSIQNTAEWLDSPSQTLGSVALEYDDDLFAFLDESFIVDDEYPYPPFETPPISPIRSTMTQSSPHESRVS
jgi:hypothetical protein